MRQKNKPRYNMWQNSAFMIHTAWMSVKSVLWFCLAEVVVGVGLNLVRLFITPGILAAVENHVAVAELLTTIVIFTGVLLIFQAAQQYIAGNTLYGRIDVRSYIAGAIVEKTHRTSYSNWDEKHFGELRSKAVDTTNGDDAPTQDIWLTLTALLKGVIGFAIYVALLMKVDILLILLILGTTIAGYFINRAINDYEYRHKEEDEKNTHELFYLIDVTQEMTGAKDIRIFGLRPWLTELLHKTMRCMESFYRRAAGIYIWGNVVDIVLVFLRNGAAYAYLIMKVLAGDLSTAEFLLYFSAIDGFTVWITDILENMLKLHRQSLDLNILREFLELPEPFVFEGGKSLEPVIGKDYEIKLENISFRYPGADRDTLSHINLTLRPGEKLAVVGLNGAGKTTLVKILCGFYDPTEGRVLLNGEDIRTFNRRDYYRMFAAVFQTFFLLAGSVAMNVAQSEAKIDMEKVKQSIASAGLTEKIESLPQQYETLLGREVYEDAAILSGGETQRLMLARALYKEGPIVVLDEPTAALDPLAEADIYQKYHEMTAGRSSVYISHRLASTRFCDRIVLMQNGKVVEEGTHEELLTQGGQYSEMFAVQSRYYQQEEAGSAE